MALGQGDNISKLVAQTLSQMADSGYSDAYICSNKQVYARLVSFCSESSVEIYTEDIGRRFLEDAKIRHPLRCRDSVQFLNTAIRRLNNTLTGEKWLPLRKPRMVSITSSHDDIVHGYDCYLQQTGKTRKDIRRRIIIVSRFLSFAEQTGCKELSDLSVKCIYDAFKSATDKPSFRKLVGAFLKYTNNYGLTYADLSLVIPSVVRHTALLEVYSPDEVEQLLSSVDRTKVLGKRDYAIILIAARLGLRASDIAAMTFSCLHLGKGTIERTQAKTRNPITLPLLDDVRLALCDYIDNARPHTDIEYIFLNLRGYGSISPESVGARVRRQLKLAGIDCQNRRMGSHSLRASLATALLAEGNDYFTIQKVLGHGTIQSSKDYVKTEVEQLRTNALPVPQPIGNFETLLVGGGRA
jgi:integrase/recombinase XerD